MLYKLNQKLGKLIKVSNSVLTKLKPVKRKKIRSLSHKEIDMLMKKQVTNQ